MASVDPVPVPFTSQPTATATPASAASRSNSLPASATAALPPLTTPWSSPQSCTWTYVVDQPDETAALGAVAFLDLEPIPGDKTLSCYPGNMFSHGRTGVFSPGSCPDGWTTASLLSNTDTASISATTTTTTAICCSYGYTLSGSACRRSVATALAVPITYNTTAGTYNVMTQSTTTLYSAVLAASTIQVLYGAEDRKQLGIDIIHGQDHVHFMSTSTRIGVSVGVGTLVLLCLGLFYFALTRHRRRREGLTEDRLMRDLRSLQGQHPSWDKPCTSRLSMSTADASIHSLHEQHQPPPPAYDPNRAGRAPGHGNTDYARDRDGEIRLLREQKAMIQRRLEELEIGKVSLGEPQARAR
ncbi:uncharacterized protein UV8b_02075 [Ustilaginoidea virens]|uniref:Uncharacterized protein n=1 Tax=Ustilaginoidea virens TaxID=1159556 RepID=A0A8E5HMS0_USTVR|nr:uncharacterized protein UV8b_02075 [Ustilaginoidea virens]QUC17834.1 hypothetical protein UV8b_02075 [Ustilaginoidea virens]